jgi:multidrug efflux pump subunit AcrB
MNAEELEGRLTTVYEKVLTTLVDNIDHIESTTISVNGLIVVKIFLQSTASVDRAMAQVTMASQTILRQLPPGTLPPLIVDYTASNVPVLQLSLSDPGLRAIKGVAHYLFPPLAEAIIFAMITSYILSRTLVPTLAMYILRAPELSAAPSASRGLYRPIADALCAAIAAVLNSKIHRRELHANGQNHRAAGYFCGSA